MGSIDKAATRIEKKLGRLDKTIADRIALLERERDRAISALDTMVEAFVVDNGAITEWQAKAARKTKRILAPIWQARRAAAKKAPRG